MIRKLIWFFTPFWVKRRKKAEHEKYIEAGRRYVNAIGLLDVREISGDFDLSIDDLINAW